MQSPSKGRLRVKQLAPPVRHRGTVYRNLIAAIAIAVGLTIVGCATALPSDHGEADLVFPVERDGILVTLGLSAATLQAGDPLRASVTVANLGSDTAFWDTRCGLIGRFSLDGPPLTARGPRKTWPGTAGLVKTSALGDGPAQTGFVPPGVPAGTRFGCRGGHDVEELRPGAVGHVEAVWYGRTSDLLPAPAGSYVVGFSFPFLGRAARGGPTDDVTPIAVQAPLAVVGREFEGLSADAAIDAALSDPLVAAWIDAELPGNRLSGARITFVDDGTWRLQIDKQDPAGENVESVAIVVINASSGAVLSRDLPSQD